MLVVCASVEEDKKAEAGSEADNIEFLQITPTTVQVQFPGITGGNLMYVEDQAFQLKLNGGTSREVPWENAIILEGNKIFTLTGLKPGTKYRLRWQAPSAQYPDVDVVTQPLTNKKAPKVIGNIISICCFDFIL